MPRAAADSGAGAAPGSGLGLLTFGHGTATQDELIDLLTTAGVAEVLDVRRFPGSRRHPHVGRDQMARWLPAARIDYRWEERLGGRRRTDGDSPHVGLRNASFRAYADHLTTDDFREAIADLLADLTKRQVAIMCAESLWWRCHRRLIADHVTLLEHTPVSHLFPDGKVVTHKPTDVARVADGYLIYDASS